MAFSYINDDQKQSINLSEAAWSVVRQDMAAFRSRTISGFFNRVILKFYMTADATLSQTRKRKYEEFCKNFSEPPEGTQARKEFFSARANLSEDQREIAAAILADNAVYKLKQDVIDRYPKGSVRTFRINNDLFQHLTNSSTCKEDAYYGDHIGRYLKAILEEYAALPYHRRERIYYDQLFKDIEDAIKGKERLIITTASGRDYEVKPYRIMTDSQSTYHYLVAWNVATRQAWPFRISGIQRLRRPSTGSGKISAKEQMDIEEALKEKDVPFMGEEIHTVRIRLTEAGIRKYNTMLHMRPRYKETKGNIYVFETTLRQARYYFEKFGPDARVLEPEELAEQMQKWHLDAAHQYD